MGFSQIRGARDALRWALGLPTRTEEEAARRRRAEQKRAFKEDMGRRFDEFRERIQSKAAAQRAEARERVRSLQLQAEYWQGMASMPVLSPAPFAIDNIELTNKCPMRCIMCPRTEHMTRAMGHMSFEVFSRVIDELVAVNPDAAREGVFLHHFGESLLHPELGRFIRYAEDAGVRTMLSVNPMAMKDRVIDELLAAAPSYVMISLDGHDNESFERIRGVANAYDLSVERLHRFLEGKVARGLDMVVELSMIDFAENAESIAWMRERWERVAGIDTVVAKRFTAWDGSAEEINAYAPPPMTNIEARSVFPIPSCRQPWEKLTVTWDGSVVPCCYDYDRKVVLGNVLEHSLSDLWNGERMRALREEFRANAVGNPLCVNCPKLYRTEKRQHAADDPAEPTGGRDAADPAEDVRTDLPVAE